MSRNNGPSLATKKARAEEIGREQFPQADEVRVGLYDGKFRLEVRHGHGEGCWQQYPVRPEALVRRNGNGRARR